MNKRKTDGARRANAPAEEAVIPEKAEALELATLVAKHPVAALAGAFGLGYAIGGGLWAPSTRRLLGVGLRLGVQFALLPALEREVAELAGSVGTALRAPTGGGTGSPTPPLSHEGEPES